MKFKYIPSWAKFIALDYDKCWYAYENRPNYCEGEWLYEGKREEVYPVIFETLGPVKIKC